MLLCFLLVKSRIISVVLSLLVVCVNLHAELIYPATAVSTGGEFHTDFRANNMMNEAVMNPLSTLSATASNADRGYASLSDPSLPMIITLDFTTEKDIKAFYLWNNASNATISSKGIKDFTLKFYDNNGGSAGGGSQVGSDYVNSAAQGPISGIYAAQQFIFSSTYIGVKSVDLIVSNNHVGSSWVGLRELAFDAEAEIPSDSPIKRVLVYLLGGQSNADGYGTTSELSAQDQAVSPNIPFYHGNAGGLSPLPAQQWIGLQPGSGSKSGNLGGFGPELNFGRKMDENLGAENVRIAVIKHTLGATNLHTNWKAGGTASTEGDGGVYQNFQATVSSGLASLATTYPNAVIQIEGMVWHQSESDTLTGDHLDYQANLTNFIIDLRLTYGSGMKFVIVQSSNSQYTAGNTVIQSRADVVQAAQQAVADSSPYNGMTSTSDLAVIPTQNIHFGTSANLITGTRTAEMMMKLPITDSDGNGLDDAWEIMHFGSTGQSPSADPDADGLTNQEESDWQTSPVVATAKPEVRMGTAGDELEWIPVDGLRYFVEQSSDLMSWSKVESFIPSTAPAMQNWSLPDTSGEQKLFFRIGVQK